MQIRCKIEEGMLVLPAVDPHQRHRAAVMSNRNSESSGTLPHQTISGE